MPSTTATSPAHGAALVISPSLPAAPKKGGRPFPRSSLLSETMSSSVPYTAGLTITSPTSDSIDGSETPRRRPFAALSPGSLRLAHALSDSFDDSFSAASVEILQPFELSAPCCTALEISTPPPPPLTMTPPLTVDALPAPCAPSRPLSSVRRSDSFFVDAAASNAQSFACSRTRGQVRPAGALSPLSDVPAAAALSTRCATSAALAPARCLFADCAQSEYSAPSSPMSSASGSFLSRSAVSLLLHTPPLAYTRGERRTGHVGAVELPSPVPALRLPSSSSVTSVHPPSASTDPLSQHAYRRVADASAPRVRFVKCRDPACAEAEADAASRGSRTPAPPTPSCESRRHSHGAVSPLVSACVSRCSLPLFTDIVPTRV